ncbi:N-acetyltransferase, partial [Cronobacter sakazakii]|nr:N-acetyltransferase [Cronobacter sakazakii]
MDNLKSKTIHLRFADASDAEFIYSLRINDSLNQHISKVSGSAETQKEWLQEYKKRELLNEEFYFIIEKNEGNCEVGTVRIYGLTNDKRFCWGSWIL